jgi:hypothetical protein
MMVGNRNSALEREQRTSAAGVSRKVPERTAALVGSSAILALGAALGVAGAGGTHALLQDHAGGPAATIQAGTLDLLIDGQESAPLGMWELGPAQAQARAFTVTNTGDVRASLSAHTAVTVTQPIIDHTQARLTPVAAAEDCHAGLDGQLANLEGYSVADLGPLASNESRTYCLELSLTPNTPSALAGQGVSFTLEVDAIQKAD